MAKAQRIEIPAAGRYRLDPVRSSVTFRTRLFGGLETVIGAMRVGNGEVFVDPAGPEASVMATINAASFWTGNPRRDDDVRSARFLEAERYREFIFRADGLTRVQGRWTLTGELMIREISNPVTLAIESVEVTGGGFRARATTRLDRFAFGFTRVTWMGGRSYDIDLTAVADPL